MSLISRLIALFRRTPQEPIKSGYIVIPRAIIADLPEMAQARARAMLSDLQGRARLKYPDLYFQVILRESNGKFKKHPGDEPIEPKNTLNFEEEL